MYLARDVKDKRGLTKCIGNERKARENMGVLLKVGLDDQTVRWTENWLNDFVQRVVISGTARGGDWLYTPGVNTGSGPV